MIGAKVARAQLVLTELLEPDQTLPFHYLREELTKVFDDEEIANAALWDAVDNQIVEFCNVPGSSYGLRLKRD